MKKKKDNPFFESKKIEKSFWNNSTKILRDSDGEKIRHLTKSCILDDTQIIRDSMHWRRFTRFCYQLWGS